MFMGEYNHTVDAKGRLIVPSKFREQLGDEFVVTKGLDGCLFVYENTEWKSLEEKLHALPPTSTASFSMLANSRRMAGSKILPCLSTSQVVAPARKNLENFLALVLVSGNA